jgi:hypothetical protein
MQASTGSGCAEDRARQEQRGAHEKSRPRGGFCSITRGHEGRDASLLHRVLGGAHRCRSSVGSGTCGRSGASSSAGSGSGSGVGGVAHGSRSGGAGSSGGGTGRRSSVSGSRSSGSSRRGDGSRHFFRLLAASSKSDGANHGSEQERVLHWGILKIEGLDTPVVVGTRCTKASNPQRPRPLGAAFAWAAIVPPVSAYPQSPKVVTGKASSVRCVSASSRSRQRARSAASR